MGQFVIHKKAFFYTDEAFEHAEGTKGSIVDTFDNLEDAKKKKEQQDIYSMQELNGVNAVDFFFYSNDYDAVYQKLENYYKTEFGLTIEDKFYFDFPEEISEEQAKVLLEIIGVTFHDIVEYADGEELNPEDFEVDEELGEF